MICGFFGVVISLERAVAIGRLWAYAGPLFAGLGGIAAVAGAACSHPGCSWPAASCCSPRRSMSCAGRQALFTFTLTLGAACWSTGNALWALGATVHAVVPVARLSDPDDRRRAPRAVAVPAALARRPPRVRGDSGRHRRRIAGHATRLGRGVFGAGLVALSLWLGKQDIARRTVRNQGLTRFIAVCLLSGYAWLAVGGAIIVVAGGLAPGSPSYDAALHALALGFVFAMVFGHAPIIFPAVLRVAVPTIRRSTCRSRCCIFRSSCGSPGTRPRGSTGRASAAC